MLPYLVVPLISATVPLISTRVLAHCQAILLVNLTWVALRCRLSTVILPSMWHRSLAGSVALPSDMQDSVLLRLLEPRLLTWKITPWWRHQMETFSVLLALCGGGGGDSSVTGEFPSQRPVTRSYDVLFDLRLNKRFSKHSRRRWFETPSRPLWRHSNAVWSRYNIISFLQDTSNRHPIARP